VRFLYTGRLQLSDDVVQFHRLKIAQRRSTEQRPAPGDWELVERDVLRSVRTLRGVAVE
jgi:methylaspartate mutase epsilon subunit